MAFDLFDKKEFDIEIFFEIIYTKLCMAFYGNVGIDDDHAGNIMINETKRIRKYNIKSRDTIYSFFISNKYHVKYIDLERTNTSTNRNLLLIPTMHGFNRMFRQDLSNFMPNIDREIAIKLFDLIINKYNRIDLFCESMWRALTNKCIDSSLYIGKESDIDEYYIDLDINDSEIEANMIHKIDGNTIPRDMPYKLWNGRPLWKQQQVQQVQQEQQVHQEHQQQQEHQQKQSGGKYNSNNLLNHQVKKFKFVS